MNEDRSSNDPGDKSWIEKISQAFSSEPQTQAELMEIIKIARHNQVIDNEVFSVIEGAMSVADMQVREVMVPRSQMVVVKEEDSPMDSLNAIIKSGHSRFPVVGETLDEVLGILLAKDMLSLAMTKDIEIFDLHSVLRPATMVPESKRLNVLLKEFREQRNHMAVVIDEYGGVSGLVTIEDVLEEIVGEIEDEYDEDSDPFIKQVSSTDYIIKALTPIEDFNEQFDASLNDEEFDTIGGLLMQNFGHVPERNEVATIDDFQFKVLNSDSRRIHLLKMTYSP